MFLKWCINLWGDSCTALLSRYQTHPPTRPIIEREGEKIVKMINISHQMTAPIQKQSQHHGKQCTCDGSELWNDLIQICE